MEPGYLLFELLGDKLVLSNHRQIFERGRGYSDSVECTAAAFNNEIKYRIFSF
jgi:hypothetical protein